MLKKKTGFTLVEIMIVVAIIALLAAIAVPNLLRAKIAANDATAKATLKTIASAMENYMIINSVYPTDPNLLLSATPPYLTNDFFNGTFNGFTFSSTLSNYTYVIVATPVSAGQTGTTSFSITTGAVLQ